VWLDRALGWRHAISLVGATLAQEHRFLTSLVLFRLVKLQLATKIIAVCPRGNQQRVQNCRNVEQRDRIMKLLHRVVWHHEQERRERPRLRRDAPHAVWLQLRVAWAALVLHEEVLIRDFLDFFMRKKDRNDEDGKLFYFRIGLSVHIGRHQIEIRIDLVVVAKLIRSIESLGTQVHGIEYNPMLSNEVLDDQEQRTLTDGRVEDDLEVFEQLFEALNCAMAKDKLHAVFLEISFLHFANDSLEMDNHDHFVPMALPAAEIEPTAFRLVDAVCARLDTIRVVNKVRES